MAHNQDDAGHQGDVIYNVNANQNLGVCRVCRRLPSTLMNEGIEVHGNYFCGCRGSLSLLCVECLKVLFRQSPQGCLLCHHRWKNVIRKRGFTSWGQYNEWWEISSFGTNWKWWCYAPTILLFVALAIGLLRRNLAFEGLQRTPDFADWFRAIVGWLIFVIFFSFPFCVLGHFVVNWVCLVLAFIFRHIRERFHLQSRPFVDVEAKPLRRRPGAQRRRRRRREERLWNAGKGQHLLGD